MNKRIIASSQWPHLLAITVLLGVSGALFAAPLQMLPTAAATLSDESRDPAMVRARTSQPIAADRLSPLASAPPAAGGAIPAVGDQLCYDFFPGASYTVTVTSVTAAYNGAWLLAGACPAGAPLRYSAIIAADGERHEIHDFQRGKLYQAVKSPAGVTTVREYDDALRPPLTPTAPLCEATPATGSFALPQGIMPLSGEPVVTNDLMICIDRSAQQWINVNGGGVTAFASAAVAKMNTALQNSGVECVIRLVHVYEIVATLSTNLTQVLNDLKAGAPPFEPTTYFRTQTGADLVTVFVDTGSAYGTVGLSTTPATLAGNSEAAFSVCAVQAVNNSHVMSHEIGHNFGAGHSKYQADEPGPSVTATYAAGWYFSGTNSLDYHTIMAYNDDGQNRYYPCDYYSTPLLEWQGAQLGDATHGDNVRVMRILKNVIANYKSRKETVSVTFNANGGTVSPGSQSYPVGVPYGSLPVPERQDHTFLYWLSDYGKVTVDTIASPLCVTLYAAWGQTVPPRPYTFSNGTIYEYNGFEQHVVVPGMIDNITVTSIAAGAFSENAAVQTITLPQSVTSIGNFAFMSMENLLEVFLPTGLTTIKDAAFHGCGKMTNITFHAAVRQLPYLLAYNCSSLVSVTLPANLTNIADSAFCGATALRNVDIPAGCVQIGKNAFMLCTSLTNCTMRTGLTTISEQAFDKCGQLRSAVLPNGVTRVNSYAFNQCHSLEHINLPPTLTYLGSCAFQDCAAASGTLTIPAGLTTIGSGAFIGLANITALYTAAENPNYANVYGVLLNKNKTLLIQCPAGKSGTFDVPYGTVEVGDCAFMSCQQLTTITMPNTVKIIGRQAFEYCTGLTWITIPATVTNMSYKCFGCCTRLKSVGFMGTPPTFGDYVFETSQQVRVLVRPGSSGWGTTQSGRPVVEWWPEFLANQKPRLMPTGFSFTIGNALGKDVAISTTSDLTTGSWAPLTNGQKQHDGERLTVTDPDAAAHAQRFYRLAWPQ